MLRIKSMTCGRCNVALLKTAAPEELAPDQLSCPRCGTKGYFFESALQPILQLPGGQLVQSYRTEDPDVEFKITIG